MPEPMRNPVTRVVSDEPRGSVSIKGSRSGASDTAYFDEKAKADAKQSWLAKKGWAGIGGVAKRPKDWEKQFEADFAKSQGQKDAIKEPKVAASPTPKP